MLPERFRDRARHLRRVATSTVSYGLKRLVRARDGDASILGEALFAELDQLKGMAMKVGQILSYMDGALPAETQEALSRLQRGVAPTPWEEVRAALESGLGGPIDEQFDVVDPDPIAAASIGQVHRGVLDGVEVAVKVQYPGVRGTFESDVRQLRRIAALASLASHVDGQAIVDELRERLLEECDYRHEADWQRRFATWFADDPDVIVPTVVDERSSGTVLTTRWCEGEPLERFVEAPQELRDRAGAALARFAWRSLFGFGAINADPHPGNQLYRPDGAVVFLDFGCVRAFDPAWLDAQRREVQALLDGDRAAFRQAVIDQGMVHRPEGFDFDEHWSMQRHLWSPYLGAPYRFDRTWIDEGMRYSRPTNPNLRKLAVPPPWIWLARLQWGLHAVLVRLGARGDFRSILLDALQTGTEAG